MKKTSHKNRGIRVFALLGIAAVCLAAGCGGKDERANTVTAAAAFETPYAKPSASESTAEAPAESPTPESTEEPSPTLTVYPAGIYNVGTDIPAEEYLIIAAGNGYYEEASNAAAGSQRIIASGSFDTFTILTATADSCLTIRQADICVLADFIAESFTDVTMRSLGDNGDGTYGPGMYKIGVMLAAGKYELVSSGSGAYFALMSDSLCTGDSVISSGSFTSNTTVTVADGQYLQVSSATVTFVE